MRDWAVTIGKVLILLVSIPLCIFGGLVLAAGAALCELAEWCN